MKFVYSCDNFSLSHDSTVKSRHFFFEEFLSFYWNWISGLKSPGTLCQSNFGLINQEKKLIEFFIFFKMIFFSYSFAYFIVFHAFYSLNNKTSRYYQGSNSHFLHSGHFQCATKSEKKNRANIHKRLNLTDLFIC